MTTPGDRAHALEVALDAAREAAELVMRVYATPFAVDYKGVNDPVTQADREANALIVERLATAFPGVPVVAEESDPASFAGFGTATAAWFVDPLDGTREFVARNGEFAVMIGLAEEGRATAGVVLCPAMGRTFMGGEGLGAYEIDAAGARRPVRASSTVAVEAASVVVSRSRRSAALDEVLTRLGVAEIT